jgi:hypothetical protein
MGPVWRGRGSISKAFLDMFNVAFRVTSNRALPPGSCHLIALEMLLLQNALLLSFTFPGETSLPLGSAAGPLWREMFVSRAFLYVSFRAASKGALPLGSSHIAPIERETCFQSPPSTMPRSSQFSNAVRMERDACFQSHLLRVSRSPQYTGSNKTKSHLPLKVPSLHGTPMGPLWREMLCFQSQWFIHSFISLKVPN